MNHILSSPDGIGTESLDWAAFSMAVPSAQQNEDYMICDAKNGLFVVADGMGGRPGGELASKIGAEAFVAVLRQTDARQRLDASVLQEAVRAANAAIRQRAANDRLLDGMGTTLVAFVLVEGAGRVVHVGDSRLYLWRQRRLTRVTRDHTLMEELIQREHISQKDAEAHPLRHILSRSLGARENVEADVQDIEVLPEDRFILATDGLTESLSDDDIKGIMSKRSRAGAASLVRAIRTAALTRGPRDDVSLVVVTQTDGRSSNGGRMGTKRRRHSQALPLSAEKVPASAWSEEAGSNRMEEISKDEEGLLRRIAECKWLLAENERKQKNELSRRFLALLKVVDAFERNFANIEARKELCTPQMNIWIGNFRAVYKLLRKFLAEEGVVPIENLNQGFDPKWHEVSERVYDPSQPDGTIVAEVERGYLLQGQLLRQSVVIVTSTSEHIDEDGLDKRDMSNDA